MTPLRKERVGMSYPSSYHIWDDPIVPPIPFIREKCSGCGLVTRRTWGQRLCKCPREPKEIFSKVE